MKARRSKISYKEKLTIRERPLSAIPPEEKLNIIADIIIERIFEVSKSRNLSLPVQNSIKGDGK